jgi:hypothetical protein
LRMDVHNPFIIIEILFAHERDPPDADGRVAYITVQNPPVPPVQ